MDSIKRSCVTFSQLGKFGRLGNCIFQIAATIGYASLTNKCYSFPEWDGAKYFPNLPIGNDPKEFTTINEPHFHWALLPKVDGNVSLHGYFQSEQYFRGLESVIKQTFTFTDDIQQHCQEELTKIYKDGWDKIVSIHLRFGDYVNNPFYVDLTKTSYYLDAIRYVESHTQPGLKIKYLVFSDDNEMANGFIRNIPFLWDEVKVVESPTPGHAMCLMSLCDAGIMANSSFSWWGNYLGKDKKIISPKSWFGPSAGLDTKDLYTEKMIKI